MRLGLLAPIVIATIAAAASPPPEYDARALRPRCAAWRHVFDQDGTASCCAAAIATALSARECLRDGRDTLYAPRQIWDCAGPTLANAENGTLLERLIDAMGDAARPQSARFLLPHPCAPAMPRADPNLTHCARAFDNCTAAVAMPPLDAAATFQLSTFNGPPDFGVILAARYMMLEIMQSGPVVAVLRLTNAIDRFRFGALPPHTVFVPDLRETATEPMLHCIVVYGWGQDPVTGLHFWRVQNSYGPTWSDAGFGRIARGTLERNWRAVSTRPHPCLNNLSAAAPCIYPPAAPQDIIIPDPPHPRQRADFPAYYLASPPPQRAASLDSESLAFIVLITAATGLLLGGAIYVCLLSAPRPKYPMYTYYK